jgi:hypothetical protein
VVHKHAITGFEPAATGTGLYDEARGLVPGNHSLVSLGTLAEVLVIDATDIGAADRGGFYLKQYFAVPRFGCRNVSYFDSTVPR